MARLSERLAISQHNYDQGDRSDAAFLHCDTEAIVAEVRALESALEKAARALRDVGKCGCDYCAEGGDVVSQALADPLIAECLKEGD